MTTVVVDPRLRLARRFPFARAEARWRFRLAMMLFCVAMTVTLYSSSENDRAMREADITAAKAEAHSIEEPHCEAMEEPDQRLAAANQTLEWSNSAHEDAARGAPVGDAERFGFEVKSERAGADCMILEGKDVSP
jgi:hypothetical protein